MAGVRRGAFTCVEWQLTLCDPIWQVTSRISEARFPPRKSYISLYLLPFTEVFLRDATQMPGYATVRRLSVRLSACHGL